MSEPDYSEGIDASPTKEFFVDMLTRDISLEDAILDLLDNCVDGVLRKVGISDGKATYKGFGADITFNGESFTITDNCGGIPWSEHDRAFRQGKPVQTTASTLPTVGTYGIGMKRAIYKMGRNCIITTRSGKDTYQVAITPKWFKNEEWHLNAVSVPTTKQEGTSITITALLPVIKEWLSLKSFGEDLMRKIESHYAVILHKGFKVTINGKPIAPKPISFRFAESEDTMRPYLFKTSVGGVDIFLAVGLREPIPGADQIEADQQEQRYSTDHAGWTVICNDRVVLYCNKDEQTGWGEAQLPQYHPQFRAISGVVEFRSNDARLLPTTTTKRGIELSSRLYSQVKNRMREGTKIFTNYTNQWKTREQEAKAQVKDVPALTFAEVKAASKRLTMAPVKVGFAGHQYKPELPRPEVVDDDCRISYRRERSKVERLAKHLFGKDVDLDERDLPKLVGEETFDRALRDASGKRK